MKRWSGILLTIMAVLLMSSMAGQAANFHRGGGGGRSVAHFHGGGWGWGPALGLGLWGLGWALTYPYYPYYGRSPVIIQQPSTEMYMQPVPEQAEEPAYWYYCREAKGYYPYVRECPNGWMKVVPLPPPQQKRE